MAKVFFSYSHADEVLRNQCETHLKVIERQGLIEIWHDRRIVAGSSINAAIDAKLHECDLILLLVSPDFLASDYCYSIEMTRALERHHAGSARVIPIILRPCDWLNTPLKDLLAVPRDGKPATKWPDLDDAFSDVTKEVRRAIDELHDVQSIRCEAATETENEPEPEPELELEEDSFFKLEILMTATQAIASQRIPAPPMLTLDSIRPFQVRAKRRKLEVEWITLNPGNLHYGKHLSFVRTGGTWYAFKDMLLADGTAYITAQFKDTIFRCREPDDEDDTHLFLSHAFENGKWKLCFLTHSLAYEEDLDLTYEELVDY